MPRFLLRHFFNCFLFAGLLHCILLAPASFAAEIDHEATFRDRLQPLLATYCKDCHSGSSVEAGFSLDKTPTAKLLLKNRKEWLRALRQVQGGVMPPEDGPKMDAGTRERMAKLIDELANAADCLATPNPGKVVLRRLTRVEYRYTIRDLMGVDYVPAASFPADDVGYGFDNIGDVLTLPPLLLEKYLRAAEDITAQAIAAPQTEIYERSWGGSQLKSETGSSRGSEMVLASRGTIDLEDKLPFAANYTLTITASGDQAGDEPVLINVLVGDKLAAEVKVPATTPTDYAVPLKLSAGNKKIGLEFANDFYVAAEGGKKAQDRNLHVQYVKLEGEHRTSMIGRQLPPTHERILFVQPSESVSADQASRQVLERIASRAFRRPVGKEELQRLVDLAKKVRESNGTYEEGIQVAIQAILVSPFFIYRVEANRNGTGPQPLNDYELATRLSYFLWSSMPDDQLFRDAWGGKLKDPKILEQHARRMLKDPRSKRFVENFAGQWLQLRNLDQVNPDPKLFPKFTESIRELMKQETLLFVGGILSEDLPVTAMLDGQFTFLNEELAGYYGIRGVTGEQFRPVSLKGTPRGGLLTQGSILTVTSNPSRTSPVKRGKWVLDNLLGTPPPAAPADVPQLEKVKLTGTLRQQMEQHRVDPACASCHKLMDPVGFALENFDAVGRWRDQDRGSAIDASGVLPDGTAFNGAADLRQRLAKDRLDLFVRCVTEKMMIYALGRGLEYYDKCEVDKIVGQLERDDLRFSTLIVSIVLSDPFRKIGVREL